MFTYVVYYYYYYYIHLMAFFQDNLGKPAPEKQNHSGKTSLGLLQQDTVSGSGISWAICKSAPCPRQMTMPVPHLSVFTCRMPSCRPTNSVKALKAMEWVLWTLYNTTYVV